MHIDECLEAVLLAAIEEPIDRTLLIDFQVVGIEVVDEVIADDFTGRTLAAESVGNELEVFFQRIAAVNGFYPFHKASGDVIIEVVIVADRDDVILVRNNGTVLGSIPFTTGIGESVNIQRVASEHTTHGIGDQRANVALKVSLANCDILVFNIWCQLILQPININVDAIKFFLICSDLVETILTFLLPFFIMPNDVSKLFHARM